MITEPVALLLLTLGWLLLPGLVVGTVIGLRGWLLVAATPALTMGFVAGVGLLLAGGSSWGPAAVAMLLLVTTVVLALPGVLLRWRRDRRWSPGPAYDPGLDGWPWWDHAGVAVALLVTGLLGVRTGFLATDEFTGVNQTWDAFFHFGAVRLIAESGDPSPASLAAIGAPASTDFYMPDAYHSLAALVYQSSGAPVVPAVNATVAVLPLLLGMGMVGLLRVATGRPAHAVCAALCSAVVAVVPYHMVGYGTLIPYAAALVALPGVLALVVALFRAPGWRVAVALGVAAAGLLHTHPQVAFLAAMIALVQLGWHLAAVRRDGVALLGALGVTAGVALALGGLVLVALSPAVGEAEFIDWPAYTRPAGAVGDLLLFSADGRQPQWWLVPLLLAGLAAVVARGSATALRPLVGAAGIIAALYVLASAYDTPLSLRLTSLWWNDRHRLAAAFAVLAIAFVAVGAVWLRDQAVAPLRRHPGVLAALVPAVVLVLGLVGFAGLTEGAYAGRTRAALAWGYGSGPVLSAGERAGLAEVDRIVAANGGGMVMNDPHDGCGWAYPLYGTAVVFPTPLTGPFDWDDRGLDRLRLHDGFDQLDVSQQIRLDVERLDIRWAVLCRGFIRSWNTRVPGMYDVGALPMARQVFSNGEVRLFRLVPPARATGDSVLGPADDAVRAETPSGPLRRPR